MSDQVPVTDADREAALAALGPGLCWDIRGEQVALAIARARAEEREACAKVCDKLFAPYRKPTGGYSAYPDGLRDCAAAIRARGEGGKA